MKGDEQRVVDAFCAYLKAHGWDVDTEVKWVDVVARRGDETIYAEVKGRAGQDTGTALDILYGQLLRRMAAEDGSGTRYAVVVPDEAVPKAERVPPGQSPATCGPVRRRREQRGEQGVGGREQQRRFGRCSELTRP